MMRRAFFLAVLGLALSACDERAQIAQSPGVLSVEPRAIEFGFVPAGQSAIRTLTLSNSGGSPVEIAEPGLTSARPVFSRAPFPRQIAPKDEIQVELSYRAPEEGGEDRGTLSLSSEGKQIEVSLHGVSVKEAPDAGTADASGFGDAKAADAVADSGPEPEDAGFADAVAPDADAPDLGTPDSGGAIDVGPVSCPSSVAARTVGSHRSALPALTWWGGGYTIVIDEVVSESPFVFELFLEQTDATGRRIAGPIQISPNDGSSSFWPRIAFSGSEYGIVHLEGQSRRATFMRADASLRPIAGSITPLGSGPTDTTAAIAWGHDSWGAAWSIDNGGVRFRRFDRSGTPIGQEVIVGAAYLSDNGTPMIATSRGWAIVSAGSPAAVYEIDLTGMVRTVVLPFNANRSSIASDGTQYAVVAGDNGGYFARVQIGGGLVAGSVAPIGTNRTSLPNVIWHNNEFLVTWSETYAGSPLPLKMARVSPSAGAAAISGAPFTTETNAGFHHTLAGACGWATVYGTFTANTFDTLEVRP
jgi:hypothetical protein